MANIRNRYSSAVHSSNLKVSKEADKTGETVVEDTDALSAMAWADKALKTGWRTTGPDGKGEPVRPAPLAVPLARFLAGDGGSAHEIVRLLAIMVFERSWDVRVKINHVQAHDMACACLAWHRNGRCRVCGGHGKTLIPGSRSFSDHDCQVCRGTGKVPFKAQFKPEHQDLADWLVAEMEREAGRAGPAAMKALSSTMELP